MLMMPAAYTYTQEFIMISLGMYKEYHIGFTFAKGGVLRWIAEKPGKYPLSILDPWTPFLELDDPRVEAKRRYQEGEF
jgi:hypothetical protein